VAILVPASLEDDDRMNSLALSERQQQLLRTLVNLYIRAGQPVGSRTLVQESGVPVSSATVRSIMADLEERGFVATPPHLRRSRPDGEGLPVLHRHAGHDAAPAGPGIADAAIRARP
jgi:hypothetical protein